MEKEVFNQYVWTIVHNIFCHDRFFGASLDRWKFMLVSQPKVPFANDNLVPNITFTYNFKNDVLASQALGDVYKMLYGQDYVYKENEAGQYLICYFE